MRAMFWALVGAAMACSPGEEKVDPVRARMRQEVGQLRQALAQNPQTPLLEFQLGQVFEKYGMIDSARAAYERSVALYEAFPEAHLRLAQIYFDDGHLRESARAYEQTVRYAPDNVAAYNNLGFVYKKLGELERATAAYERAIAVDSAFVQAYNNLGQLYKLQGQHERAIALYHKAIEVDADFPEAYVNLGELYRERGDAAEGEVWRQFLERFGDDQQYSAHAQQRLRELEELPRQSRLP